MSKLRERREELGLSRTELSVKSGVGMSTIEQIERGVVKNRQPRIKKDLLKALKVDFSEASSYFGGNEHAKD